MAVLTDIDAAKRTLSSFAREHNEHGKRVARKFGRMCKIDMTEDFLQDWHLALLIGKDPRDYVSNCWRIWTRGNQSHRRRDIPVFVGEIQPDEYRTVSDETESYVDAMRAWPQMWRLLQSRKWAQKSMAKFRARQKETYR